jgi:integrase
MRTRGSGCVLKLKNSKNWYISFYQNGKQLRESTGSESKSVAEALLRKRLSQAGQGAPIESIKRLTYEDVKGLLIGVYKNGDSKRGPRRSLITRKNEDGTIEYDVCGLKPLDAYFAGWKVVRITTDAIAAYRDKRLREGSEGPTVNRSLALLRKMMNLARQAGKLQHIPYFAMCAENEPRQGYISPEQFTKLAAMLPESCRLFLEILYWTDARCREIERVTWDLVDLDAGVIRLGNFTKNGHPRTLPLTHELAETMKKMFKHDGPVFNTHVPRKGWISSCKKLGLYSVQVQGNEAVRLPFRIHDLRHTAITEMRNAGIDNRTIKLISGHRTDSVFERYGTQDEAALKIAVEQRQLMQAKRTSASSSQVAVLPEPTKSANA